METDKEGSRRVEVTIAVDEVESADALGRAMAGALAAFRDEGLDAYVSCMRQGGVAQSPIVEMPR